MGECGCGHHGGYDYQLPAPDGKVYGFVVYGGCDYCDASAGVSIDLVNPEEEPEMLEHAEQLLANGPIDGIQVIHADDLLGAMKAFRGFRLDGYELDDDSFGSHERHRLIRIAVNETRFRAYKERNTPQEPGDE